MITSNMRISLIILGAILLFINGKTILQYISDGCNKTLRTILSQIVNWFQILLQNSSRIFLNMQCFYFQLICLNDKVS